MIFVYAQLSEYDLGFIRLGGSGLGNLLMIYGRALTYADENGYQMIWPTWASLKIGPYVRREKDKRFYGDLLRNRSCALSGVKKAHLLLASKKIDENNKKQAKDGDVIVFHNYISKISDAGLLNKSEIIAQNLRQNQALKTFDNDELKNVIAVHVRLGDFNRVSEDILKDKAENSSIPIHWYVSTIKKVRSIIGEDYPVYVFSDGTEEELAPLINLKNIKRVFYGNALNDILAMSEAPMLISSGSTFSIWARYIGRMSTIAFPGQLREKLLTDEDVGFETELDDSEGLSLEIKNNLLRLYFRDE